MKTSKIIFISLLSTIALFILAAFINIRINGSRNGLNMSDIKVNKQTIPSFKVLYVHNSTNIHIVQNDSSFIEVSWPKDSLYPHINFSIKEDTLMVSDIRLLTQSTKYLSVKICATDSLESILLKNSDITIERFNYDKMFLDMNKSHVWFNQEESSFNVLDIIAKNHSNISARAFKVGSLGIVLQNSEANLEIITKNLNGTLSDSSRINTRQSAEISLKKDFTSKIKVNDH